MQEDTLQNDKVIVQFTAQAKLFHSPEYSLSSKEYIDWAIQRMPLFPEARVLDVAAGTGLLSLAVSPHVRSVIAMDITDAMLQEGRKEAEHQGIQNLDFRIGDAYHIDYAEQYDIAMSRLAFHHLLDPNAVMEQMTGAVKSGGTVVICDLLSPDDAAVSERYNNLERLRDDSHTTALTSAEFTFLFERSGFQNIKAYFRHVVNDLESWMKMTATPEHNREIIRHAIRTELNGGEKTGFSPFAEENGQIKFAHRWMLIIGTKP